MSQLRVVAALAVLLFGITSPVAQAETIAYFGGAATPGNEDPLVIAHLESLGHTVTYHSPNAADPAAKPLCIQR